MLRKALTLSLLAVLAVSLASCAKLQARDNLNKGIKAFKEGHFERAVEYFKTASELDPDLTNAELYLATAYAQQFIPGAPSEENQKFADNAIATFEKVLEKDPKSISAVAGLAGLYQSRLEFTKALEYYKMQTQLEPANPTPFYAIGSVAWYRVFDKNSPPPLEEQPAIVDEGISSLNKALELNPDYDEAMSFMNLLLREKARLTDNEEEKQKFIAEADATKNTNRSR
jgi:tetratricopeptide (TPR) repeat protein